MQLSCPKCEAKAPQGSIPIWQFIVAIILFPIGLLAFFAGRNPTTCPKCGYTWKA